MNPSTWRLQTLLMCGFSVILAALLAVAAVGWLGQARNVRAVGALYNDRMVPLEQLGAIQYSATRARVLLMDALDVAQPDNTSKRLTQYRETVAVMDRQWRAYLGTEMTPEEMRLIAEVKPALQNFLTQGLAPVAQALELQQYERARELLFGQLSPLNAPLTSALARLVSLQVQVGQQEYEDTQQHAAQMQLTLLALTALAVLVSVASAWAITRLVIRRLGTEPAELAQVAERIAQGQLGQMQASHSAPGSVSASMELMRAELVQIVTEVRQGSASIASATIQIAQGNLNLSQRTEEQAMALEEIAATLQEVGQVARANADHAQQAYELTQNATHIAREGGGVVGQAVSRMNSISESSNRIVDIIGVIDSIAFQTNILALNAAVEAARAGEQGRGFAVVAGEVRNLASRSATAAREIKQLITESKERVDSGADLMGQLGGTMDAVVLAIKKVSGVVGQISLDSQEQSHCLSQVSEAMDQIDETTQQNAALVEESTAASASLEQQSQALLDTVSVFRVEPGATAAVALTRPLLPPQVSQLALA
jgi:methyl-accepting chemotaxis protein